MGAVAGIDRIGGHIGIDFANTLGGLPEGPDDEYLFSYGDLVTWVSEARLLDQASTELSRKAGSREPEAAARLFGRAVRLRAGVDAILRATLDDDVSPDPGDLALVEEIYRDALAHAHLASQPSARFGWVSHGDDIDQPLWILAHETVDLLQSAPLHLLRRCGHCRWLFLDTSRNHNRRWCRMETCGSIVKMRRYRIAHSTNPSPH